MRRATLTTIALILVSPTPLVGQERPRVEIGTSAAVGLLDFGEGDDVTFLALPGNNNLTGPSVYASFFPSESLVIEPEASFSYQSRGDDSVTRLGLTGRVKYLFRGAAVASPYLAGEAGLLRIAFDGAETGYSFGGGVGYRAPFAGALAVSVEGRYRRWTGEDLFGNDDLNEFALVVALGAVVGR